MRALSFPGLAVFALACLPLSAFAGDLDGFGPFKFGTSLSAAKAEYDLTVLSSEGRETVTRVADRKTVIGYDFTVDLEFQDDVLREIWLSSRHDAVGLGSCRDHWDNVFGALDSEYGPPDNEPTRDVSSVGANFKARFTVAQGKSVQVHTDFLKQTDLSDRGCETFVIYSDRTDASDTGF